MSVNLPQQWLDRATEDLVVANNDCATVDQYYVPTRYPDGIPGGLPGGMPGKTEAQETITAAEKILRFISTQLT